MGKDEKQSSSEDESSSSEIEAEKPDKSIMKKDRSDSLHFNITDDDDLFTVKKNVQIESESDDEKEKQDLVSLQFTVYTYVVQINLQCGSLQVSQKFESWVENLTHVTSPHTLHSKK